MALLNSRQFMLNSILQYFILASRFVKTSVSAELLKKDVNQCALFNGFNVPVQGQLELQSSLNLVAELLNEIFKSVIHCQIFFGFRRVKGVKTDLIPAQQ